MAGDKKPEILLILKNFFNLKLMFRNVLIITAFA